MKQEMTDNKKMYLKIANSRGKKPVLRDIKKAYGIISDILIEINDCEGRRGLKQCSTILWEIMHDND